MTRSSASTNNTQSWDAWAAAKFFCAENPGQDRMHTRAPWARARAPVSSVLSASTTRISSAHASEARSASMFAASFLVMTAAVSFGTWAV